MTDAEDWGAEECGGDGMGGDDRLKALFAQDQPPARDPLFQAAVMERLARRRFVEDTALISGAAVLLGLVLWAVWPSFAPLVTSTAQQLAPVGAAATLAVVVLVLSGGRLPAVLSPEHD